MVQENDTCLNQTSEIWEVAKDNFTSETGLRGYDNNWDTNISKQIEMHARINISFAKLKSKVDRFERFMHQILSYWFFRSRSEYKKHRLDLNNKILLRNLDEIEEGFQSYWDSYSQKVLIEKSYSSVRIAYYMFELSKHIKLNNKKLNILEIGAGAANLAFSILSTATECAYVIIDLPEVGSVAKKIFSKHKEIQIHNDIASFEADQSSKKILWITPDEIDQINHMSFDVMLNTESFAEMQLSVALEYCKLASKFLRQSGIFLNVNRIARDPNENDKRKVYSSPVLYNPTDLELIYYKFDQFRACYPDFFNTPNLISVYKNAKFIG